MPETSKKGKIKTLLVLKLTEKGVFSGAEEAEEAENPDTDKTPQPEVSSPPRSTTNELRLTLQREVELRKKQLDVDTLHLRLKALELKRDSTPRQSSISHAEGFDVGKHIVLVPPFRETEVDSYFSAFERIAAMSVWPLLIQCKFVGKAQEMCSSLSLEDSLAYDKLKSCIL